MLKWFRYLFPFLLICFVLTPLSPQDYSVTVSIVHVWVKAVDSSGQPVRGLTENDFTIYEDDAVMPPTCFEEQVVEGTAATNAPETKTAEKVSKKFVLFLDLFNTSPRELSSIKPHLADFVRSLSNGGHEVMLAALMPNGKLGIVSPFTTDLNRIRVLINKAQPGADRTIASRKNIEDINRILGADAGSSGKGGVERVDKIRDAQQLARSFASDERSLSEFTLKAIDSFSEHLVKENLGNDPVVVYVSGGFSVDPGRQYYDIVNDFAAGSTTNEEFMTTSHMQDSNMDMRNEIKRSLGKLNKMNVTFYTIDTVGLGGESEYQDSLVEMANETGGLSFYNSQNFKTGLTDVVTDLNHQYLLCFRTPTHAKKGEYHKIKVTTKRSGVDLRHRKGYID